MICTVNITIRAHIICIVVAADVKDVPRRADFPPARISMNTVVDVTIRVHTICVVVDADVRRGYIPAGTCNNCTPIAVVNITIWNHITRVIVVIRIRRVSAGIPIHIVVADVAIIVHIIRTDVADVVRRVDSRRNGRYSNCRRLRHHPSSHNTHCRRNHQRRTESENILPQEFQVTPLLL